MPYDYPDNIPDQIKALPQGAQKIWVSAFNAALETYEGDEERARKVAWAAVKKKYEKGQDGEWQQIKEAKAVLSLEARGGAPEWIRLLPLGEVTLGDDRDPFFVDQNSLASIIEHFESRGNDMVVDYEHQTMDGGQAPAAGWIKELQAREDGLWARVDWTERALNYISNREYRYFSPVIALDKKRRATRIMHVALTNFPAINNLPALAARYGLTDLEGAAPEGNRKSNKKEEKFKMLTKIINLLGLKDDADETDVWLAVKGLKDDHTKTAAIAQELTSTQEALKAAEGKARDAELKASEWELKISKMTIPLSITQALNLEPTDTAEKVINRIQGLKDSAEQVKVTMKALAELRNQVAKEKAEALIAEALKTGRIDSAGLEKNDGRWRKIAHSDPEFFKSEILGREEYSAVPLDKLKTVSDPDNLTVIDPVQAEINRKMGVSEEIFMKYQQRQQQ